MPKWLDYLCSWKGPQSDPVDFTLRPKFCGSCGRMLVPDARVRGYNTQTGEPIYLYPDEITCPSPYCRESAYFPSFAGSL